MLESGNSCNLEKSLQHFKQNICTKFEQILFVMMNSSCPIETAMNCFSIHFRLFHWRIRFAISSDQKAPPSLEAGCPARLRSGQSFVCCSHVLEMPSCINFARCGCGQLLQSMASNRKGSRNANPSKRIPPKRRWQVMWLNWRKAGETDHGQNSFHILGTDTTKRAIFRNLT